MRTATAVKQETLNLLTAGDPSRLAGFKVSLGCTWGALTDDAVHVGPTTLPRGGVIDPLLEAELVFRVESSISPDSTIEDILDACRVAPGIEIADSRWEGWRPSFPEQFVVPDEAQIEADNAVSGWLIVGDSWLPGRDARLPDVEISMRSDGRTVAAGSLASVMGHPAEAVRWLIGRLAERDISLRPGQVVSSGCPYSTLVTVTPAGGTWQAVVEDVGLATVTVSPEPRSGR